jgi:IS5 family transposase
MGSFFELGVKEHLGSDNQLLKLGKIINWNKLLPQLGNVHKEDGPRGYDPLKMFKAILLGQWHSLSDPGLEQSLRVRLDFLQFTGFTLGDNLPDETTFCRFRNKLIKQGKLDLLLNEINAQLESAGLKVKSADTAIVDATIIKSNARPNKTLEQQEDGSYEKKLSADVDAKWLKKGKKSYFGYQGFARVDKEGFINKTHVTPANLPETKELDKMSDGLNPGTRVMTDKGFSSKENREMLRSKKVKTGLMYKATKNHNLTQKQSLFNKLVSKVRWRVEQCFGTMKRLFGMERASYFTTEKVDGQFKMKAMCLNLLKAINKVEFA